MSRAEISTDRITDWLRSREERPRPDEGGLFSFLLLVGAAIALGAALWWIDGLPHLPSSPPDWERAQRILLGSDLPYGDVIYVTASIGWLLLFYLGLSMALRLVVALAVGVTDGAAWARTALRLSNLVTVPLVRRAMDAAVAGVLLLAAWLPSAGRLKVDGEADTVTAGIVATMSGQEHSTAAAETADELQPLTDAAQGNEPPRVVSYTVVRGDNLWDIARRFYGDGSLYPRIFEANCGRVMTTGESFTNPRLIRPDWVLEVPLPAHNLDASGERLTYRVQRGDSLWAIAARFLGDGFRWPEIWELNGNREMNDGRQFHNAELIYPGWVLELPIEPSQGSNPVEQPDSTPPPAPSPQLEQPSATAVESEPTLEPPPVPSAEPPAPGNGSDGVWGWAPSRTRILVGAAGLAGAGGAALAVRELVRRNGAGVLRLPTRTRQRGTTGDAGRVLVAARSLLQALEEQGFADLQLVLARESERHLDFAIDCSPGDADALARQRYAVGRRLACAIDGSVQSPTRVDLTLSGFQRLAGLLVADSDAGDALLLVPVGADAEGVHYLNLAAAASTVVVGSRQQTCDLLSSWVATLGATHSPERLMLLPTTEAAAQIGQLSQPHVHMVNQTADVSLEALTSELEETIVARGSSDDAEHPAALVALLALSGEVEREVQRVDVVLRRGPEHSIFTTAFGEEIPSDMLESFGARVLFGGGADDAEGEGSTGPQRGQLALVVDREPPIILAPVAVRTEPPRHANGHGPEERGHTTKPETPLAEEPGWEEPRPEDEAPAEPAEAPLPAIENEPDREAGDSAAELGEAEAFEPEEMEGAEPKMSEALASRQPSLLGADADRTEDSDAVVAGPVFSVRCFGSFQVEAGNDEVTGWTIQKARELLAYLVARGGSRVLREEAAEALWPEEHADHSRLLANAAYHLRRALKRSAEGFEGEVLTTMAQRYHLALGLFRTDIGAFEAHLGRAGALRGADALAEYERALALYRDDFLADEPFEWAMPYREQYRRQFVEAAHGAAKLALDLRDTSKAMEISRAIMARDPIDEEAARGLMRCYAKVGDVNGVRKVYKVLTESLRRELEDENAGPLPETTALFEELTGQSARR